MRYWIFYLLIFTSCWPTDRAAQDTGLRSYDQAETLTSRGAPSMPPALLQLQGRWTSAADGNEIVEFSPNSYTSYYEGRKIIEESLDFFTACPNICAQGGSVEARPCFVVRGEYDTTCFYIMEVSNDRLEIQLAGGDGGRLTYTR